MKINVMSIAESSKNSAFLDFWTLCFTALRRELMMDRKTEKALANKG